MNLMETGNKKLKSDLVSLQRDYLNPNAMILPIPEKMDEEEFLRRLYEEEEGLRYHLDGLKERYLDLYYLYKDKKITDEEFYAKRAELNRIAQPFNERW